MVILADTVAGAFSMFLAKSLGAGGGRRSTNLLQEVFLCILAVARGLEICSIEKALNNVLEL